MEEEKKPIPEFAYRIIAMFMIFPPIIYSIMAAYNDTQPYTFFYRKVGYSDDRALIAFSCTFLVLIMIPLIIMLALRPFAQLPKHPWSGLSLERFMKGDDDGYFIKEKEELPVERHLAEISDRLLAALLDLLIATVFMLVGIILNQFPELIPGLDGSSFKQIGIPLFLIGIVYFIFKDVFNGQSIAKRLFRIRVVDASSLESTSFLKLIGRQLPSMLCSLLMIVDFFMIISSQKRQKLGDSILQTIVIKYEINELY